jgi:uncharacterized protein (UPF0276 family)
MFHSDPRQAAWPAGIGFRTPHYADILAARPAVGFLEVHPENYMAGGERLRQLERVRREHRVSLHGVGMSLGGATPIDARHLERLAKLAERIEPCLVSEHLSWSGVPGVYLNDLVPLPLTEETLVAVCRNVERVQARLRRPILVENVSAYFRYTHSTIAEPEFMAELARRTGCGVLLDVNNVLVTCTNVGGDPSAWFEALAPGSVGEIHLAGHSVVEEDGVRLLIDDHGSLVDPAVFALYAEAVRRFPDAATLIEWDSRLPPLPELLQEAQAADRLRAQALLAEVSHVAAA